MTNQPALKIQFSVRASIRGKEMTVEERKEMEKIWANHGVGVGTCQLGVEELAESVVKRVLGDYFTTELVLIKNAHIED